VTATNLTPTLSTSRRSYRRVIAVGVGAVFVVGALGAGVAYATTRPAAPLTPGTARLVPGDAAVTVNRVSPTAAADAPLRSGDALTVTRGVAILQTATGRLFARPGTTITFGGTSPRLKRGEVLIDSLGGSKAFSIVTQAGRVAVDGVARIHQGLSLEVGVYDGLAKIKTASASLTVPSLRRAVIAGVAGSTMDSTTPLQLDATDSWDRRLMGVALELDAVLNSRSRGLTLQVAGAPADVREKVLSATGQWSDLTVLAPELAVGEAVVAAELARAARLRPGGADNALKMRSEGASWGLIAVSQGLKTIPAEIPGIDEAVVPVVNRLVAPVVDLEDSVIVTPPPQKVRVPESMPPVIDGKPVVTTPPPVEESEPVVVNPLGPLVKGLGSILSGLLS